MYELENPDWFWLLMAIPALWLYYALVVYWKKKKRKQFADLRLFNRLSPNYSNNKLGLKFVIYSLAIAMLSLAMVNPKMGTKMETMKRQGVDLVFALDVSKSMLAEDITPNRLEKSKQLISKTIDELTNDRIGIIVYAGGAYPLLPITDDYGAAKMFLSNVDTEIVPSYGTAIGDAIAMTDQFYDDANQKNKVLFIISDGEDHGSDAVEMAKIAHNRGVQIFTIGVGKSSGGPIPVKKDGRVIGYKKDNQGKVVVTQLKENTLREIADAAGGDYTDGTSTRAVVGHIEEVLNGMEKTEFESKVFAEYADHFQWFLGIALFLLLIDVFVLERKTRWIQKLNLFNEKKAA